MYTIRAPYMYTTGFGLLLEYKLDCIYKICYWWSKWGGCDYACGPVVVVTQDLFRKSKLSFFYINSIDIDHNRLHLDPKNISYSRNTKLVHTMTHRSRYTELNRSFLFIQELMFVMLVFLRVLKLKVFFGKMKRKLAVSARLVKIRENDWKWHSWCNWDIGRRESGYNKSREILPFFALYPEYDCGHH